MRLNYDRRRLANEQLLRDPRLELGRLHDSPGSSQSEREVAQAPHEDRIRDADERDPDPVEPAAEFKDQAPFE